MNAEKAASEAVDPDRLLDGEDPTSTFADDAVHWKRVYQELLDYKIELLATTRQRVEEMERRAAEEVEKTDLRVIGAEAARLRRRLDFWERRADELGATTPN
ncbi:MAG: hypothetical protein ACR2GX_00785 [Candidatus Dormibacteria bacterium]